MEEDISEHHRYFKGMRCCIHMHFVTPFKRLERIIPHSSLDSVTLDSFRKIFGGIRDYIKVYKGLAADPYMPNVINMSICMTKITQHS